MSIIAEIADLVGQGEAVRITAHMPMHDAVIRTQRPLEATTFVERYLDTAECFAAFNEAGIPVYFKANERRG